MTPTQRPPDDHDRPHRPEPLPYASPDLRNQPDPGPQESWRDVLRALGVVLLALLGLLMLIVLACAGLRW